MTIEHLAATEKPERLSEVLARDGCCVVDQLVAPERLGRVRDELRSWLDGTRAGRDDFTGKNTRRIGALIARSPTARNLIEHPLVLGTVRAVLHDSTNFHLHLTQVIAIGPGETAQDIHRDQWAFDFFRFPRGYEVQCNTLWAMTDFTLENGATRVIPGSNHYDDKLRLTEHDSEPAEMRAGSALFYTGSLYHGAGAEQLRSDLAPAICGGHEWERGWSGEACQRSASFRPSSPSSRSRSQSSSTTPNT